MEMGKQLYEAEANTGATQADAGAAAGTDFNDDNVVDAEVVEDDEIDSDSSDNK